MHILKSAHEKLMTGFTPAGTFPACDFKNLMTKNFQQGIEMCDFKNLMTKTPTPPDSEVGSIPQDGMPMRNLKFANEKSPRSGPRTGSDSPRPKAKDQAWKNRNPAPKKTFLTLPKLPGPRTPRLDEREGYWIKTRKNGSLMTKNFERGKAMCDFKDLLTKNAAAGLILRPFSQNPCSPDPCLLCCFKVIQVEYPHKEGATSWN